MIIVDFWGSGSYKLRWTGGKIEGKGTGWGHNGIRLSVAIDSVVDGLNVTKCEGSGITLKECTNTHIKNAYISDCTSPHRGGTSGQWLGYGVLFARSKSCSVRDSHFNNNRHGVAGGQEDEYDGIGILVDGNYFTNGGLEAADIDSHEECRDWVVSNNTVVAGTSSDSWGGIALRGDNMYIHNNTVVGNSSSCHGIILTSYEPENAGVGMSRVVNNTIRGCDVGIRVTWEPGYSAIRILVSGNDISTVYECGIKTYTGIGKMIISNNIIYLTNSGTEGIHLLEHTDQLIDQ